MRVVELMGNSGVPLALLLRPLTGADEWSLTGSGSTAAAGLLDRVASGPAIADLTVSQIDRALAA